MKICWWTVYPTANETELLTSLRAQGVDVAACYYGLYDDYRHLLGWKDRPLEPWEYRVPTIAAARKAIPDFEDRIQTVPSYSDGLSWRLIVWCVRHRRPWFVVTEGSRMRWFARPVLRLFCWCIDRYALMGFFYGRAAAAQYARFGVRESKCSVCAYALPKVPPDLPQRDAALTYVYAGVLLELKAVDVIAEAFRRVHAEFPHVRLLVVGSGPLESAFTGTEGVELVGAVSPNAVWQYLARGHVVLQPSRWEGWGLSLLEGAACGLAMIGSDHTPSAVDRIVDGENGYIVPAGDVEALSAAMRRYAADPDLAVRHGAQARESVRDMTGTEQATRMIAGLERGRDIAAAEAGERHSRGRRKLIFSSFRRQEGWCVAVAYALAGARRRARARCRVPGTVLPIVFHDSPAKEVEGVLAALKKWGFRFVSSEDVLAGRAADGNCAWISFDDGWCEMADALPVLERFNAPASVFIAPGETARGWVWTDNLWNLLSDSEWHQWYALPAEERYARVDAAWAGRSHPRRLLDEAGVRKIAQHPLVTVENHFWTHPSAPHRPEAEVLGELDRAQRTLTEWTGRAPRLAAYPFGRGTPSLDAALRARGLVPVYTRQGLVTAETFGTSRNMALAGMTRAENLGRILQAWPKVGVTL